MPVNRVYKYLKENDVDYDTMSHTPAFTAQRIAASTHISGKEVAKTVMVKLDGEVAMAVLPASKSVDFYKLREAAHVEDADLAVEDEFRELFPNCELGAMPPFGNLYNLRVLSDASLAEDEEIAFSAGTHAEVLKVPYADYERLVQPEVASFGKG